MSTTKAKSQARNIMEANPGMPYKTALAQAQLYYLGFLSSEFGTESLLQYAKLVGPLDTKFLSEPGGLGHPQAFLKTKSDTILAGLILDCGEWNPGEESFETAEEYREFLDSIFISDAADAYLQPEISRLRNIGLYWDQLESSEDEWNLFQGRVLQAFIPASQGDVFSPGRVVLDSVNHLVWFPVRSLEEGHEVFKKLNAILNSL